MPMGMPTADIHASTPVTRHADHRRMAGHHYRRPLIMAALSFAAMYVLMASEIAQMKAKLAALDRGV